MVGSACQICPGNLVFNFECGICLPENVDCLVTTSTEATTTTTTTEKLTTTTPEPTTTTAETTTRVAAPQCQYTI